MPPSKSHLISTPSEIPTVGYLPIWANLHRQYSCQIAMATGINERASPSLIDGKRQESAQFELKARAADCVYIGIYATSIPIIDGARELVEQCGSFGGKPAELILDAPAVHDPHTPPGIEDAMAELLGAARELNLPIHVVSQDPAARMSWRDATVEDVLGRQKKIILVTGDLNLQPGELPEQYEKKFGMTQWHVVHHYLPDAHWQSFGHDVNPAFWEVGPRRSYHVRAHPVTVQQSFLHSIEQPPLVVTESPVHAFQLYVTQFSDEFEFISVKGPRDITTVETLVTLDEILARIDKDAARFALERINLGESFVLPRAQWVHLADHALQHIAEEALHWCRGVTHPTAHPTPLRIILEEAAAFAASRSVAEQRPVMHTEDLKNLADDPQASSFEQELANAVLEAVAHPQLNDAMLLGYDEAITDGIMHLVGYRLGAAIDAAWRDGTISAEQRRNFIRDPFVTPSKEYAAWRNTIASHLEDL